MEESRLYTCCFFGHRKIAETDELNLRLYTAIEELIINKKVHTFLFGSKSQFNALCHEIVSNLKEKYPHTKRIYVRAEFPYITDSYKDFLLESYEDTYFPEKVISAGKASYVERNYEMIRKSNFCICYYSENYTPPKQKNSKNCLFEYQPQSGTKLAYEYAKKKGLYIKNVK